MTGKKVFLAADVFIAFLDRNHPKHLHASAFFRYFAQEHFYLYTSNEIVIATYQKVSQSISGSFAKEFLKVLSESAITILSPDDTEMKKALQTVVSSFSEVGLDECLMLVIAEKRHIPYICTLQYIHTLFGREIFYLPL